MSQIQESPPILERDQGTLGPPRMSLAARLLNVFAVPSEVFCDVAGSRTAFSSWLVPCFLGALVGVASALIFLSQPAIQKQFHEKQAQFVEQTSKSGTITPQQREAAEKLTSPEMLKLFGAAGAAAGSFFNILWWGFILWFLSRRMLGTAVPFEKAMEVAGLAAMINVLGSIVTMLLLINFGSPPGQGLGFMIKDFDTARKSHLFAGSAYLFSFWVVGVRSIGLAQLTGATYARAAWLVVAFWFFEQSLLILSGLGQLAL